MGPKITVKGFMLFAFIACLLYLLFGPTGLAYGLDAEGFEKKDYALYFGTTDMELTVSWDHNEPRPDRYEVRLWHVERETESPAGTGGTPENRLTFKLPRSGHFVAWVRACMDTTPEGFELSDDCPALPCCSAWSPSTDPAVATVNGEARGWWIYGFVAPPGPIIINEGP